MTSDQHRFIHLAVIDQWTYSDIEKEIGVDRAQLSQWWEELKDYRESLSKIRRVWKAKCTEVDFWVFYQWYNETERICHYCKIKEEDVKTLIERGKIHTKRLVTRGRKLEIERREPNLPYDNIENLVYCCYWCNNAKTDEFTEEEFKAIGQGFAMIWNNRLNDR